MCWRIFLEDNVQYLEKLHDLHIDLPFMPERMKIEKVEKLVVNLHEKKTTCYSHKKLKQTLNYGSVLK